MIINDRKVKGDDELCELLRTEFKGHLGERKAGVFLIKLMSNLRERLRGEF